MNTVFQKALGFAIQLGEKKKISTVVVGGEEVTNLIGLL